MGGGVVERRRKKDKGRVCVICMVKVEECPARAEKKAVKEANERSALLSLYNFQTGKSRMERLGLDRSASLGCHDQKP